jgi:DNA-binding response OmpR family regulator
MKILIVEDDEKIAKNLKKGLELNSYAVDVTYNSDDFMSSSEVGSYDLFILDRMLPGSTDGIGIIKQLREKGVSTPILMLSAKDSITDKVVGLNAGADDYLPKPFSFLELLARVRTLLKRGQISTEYINLSYQDVELDEDSKTATRAGQDLELSAKEFAILRYFMQHVGKAISKQELMDHVWSLESDVLPNTVEVYINSMRKKIEAPFQNVIFGPHVTDKISI